MQEFPKPDSPRRRCCGAEKGAAVAMGGMRGSCSQCSCSYPSAGMARWPRWLDENYLGRKFAAYTRTAPGHDYHMNRAVLDRMMASLELAEQ